ncbi:MAG: EVE domain-containing protein [Bacteroidetes bacterium]|jgi:predicted RNA-binding protein with PUA-like domain|nr:MAG: EVE domain-containing protein [Bacteroidota bacterium]
MAYWLIKSEPFKYSWEQLLKDGKTFWDGVRNFQARKNLMSMKKGDKCLFYHSNEGLAIVGIAEVIREYYPDPTDETGKWVCVDVKPYKPLKRPVTLQEIKEHPVLQKMQFVRQQRLSVSIVTEQEYNIICQLGGI